MERQFTATLYIFFEGKTLLHCHPKLGKWVPPGGHLEPNETPPEAAIREAKEETGLDVAILNKVLEGRPHCVDAMMSGDLQLVINTTDGDQSLEDSFSIRRTALTRNVPHYTTLTGARAAVEGIEALKRGTLDVAPLQSYFKSSS